MPDGVVTRLGRDVVNMEGAREVAGRVDSCLRRNDGRGSGNDGRGSGNDGRGRADADEGAGMTRPMPALVTRL